MATSEQKKAKRKQNRDLLRKEKNKKELLRREAQKNQIKSVDQLLQGALQQYWQLEGAVCQLEQVAKLRADWMKNKIEKDPSKYAKLRADAYDEYMDKIKPLREVLTKLAAFVGKAHDVPTNYDKMMYLNENMQYLYEAQFTFDRCARELQLLDERFADEISRIETPNMDPAEDTPEMEEIRKIAEDPNLSDEERTRLLQAKVKEQEAKLRGMVEQTVNSGLVDEETAAKLKEAVEQAHVEVEEETSKPVDTTPEPVEVKTEPAPTPVVETQA